MTSWREKRRAGRCAFRKHSRNNSSEAESLNNNVLRRIQSGRLNLRGPLNPVARRGNFQATDGKQAGTRKDGQCH
jgi:hypothetical protein